MRICLWRNLLICDTQIEKYTPLVTKDCLRLEESDSNWLGAEFYENIHNFKLRWCPLRPDGRRKSGDDLLAVLESVAGAYWELERILVLGKGNPGQVTPEAWDVGTARYTKSELNRMVGNWVGVLEDVILQAQTKVDAILDDATRSVVYSCCLHSLLTLL